MGLLDGDLIDPRLVDPVDDRVSQFTHQLGTMGRDTVGYISVLVAFSVKYDGMHDIIITLMSSGSQVSRVSERTLEKWTPRLLLETETIKTEISSKACVCV